MLKRFSAGNLTGAFADGAILFPLVAALSLQTGMNGTSLLATAGAAYIAAGWIFRIPMPVQPLKSVVVAALALGASASDVSFSGIVVGISCLILSFCNADKLALLVPKHLVHGLQIALGIMLVTKGCQTGISGDTLMKVLFGLIAATTIFLSSRAERPVMGWVATAGIAIGIASIFYHPSTAHAAIPDNSIHPGIILSLVLPQMALTLANSVIGTADAAQKYFGAAADKVTPSRLLRSIGIGNIIVAPFGGLPFCHGAGGLTAHVKGGAQSWHMNLVIGGTLIVLAALSALLPSPLIPAYPKVLMAALLVATGWFHLRLVLPSWKNAELRWILILMGLAAFITQDMLVALGVGIICEGMKAGYKKLAGQI